MNAKYLYMFMWWRFRKGSFSLQALPLKIKDNYNCQPAPVNWLMLTLLLLKRNLHWSSEIANTHFMSLRNTKECIQGLFIKTFLPLPFHVQTKASLNLQPTDKYCLRIKAIWFTQSQRTGFSEQLILMEVLISQKVSFLARSVPFHVVSRVLIVLLLEDKADSNRDSARFSFSFTFKNSSTNGSFMMFAGCMTFLFLSVSSLSSCLSLLMSNRSKYNELICLSNCLVLQFPVMASWI